MKLGLVELLLVGCAGFAGSLSRYLIGGLVLQITGAGFPCGTAVVNVSGCFLFGLLWTIAEERMGISPQTKVILLTGFVGAFTTFSTFVFETAAQLRCSQWLAAAASVFGQLLLGLVMLTVGMEIGRRLF